MKLTPAEDAMTLFMRALGALSPRVDTIETGACARDRILAAPAVARISSPMFNAAALDGIAVRAGFFAEARVRAGSGKPVLLYPKKDFVPVNTGQPVKEPFNAVIKIEDVEGREDGSVRVRRDAAPLQNVRLAGEDIEAGETILPAGRVLGALDIGALLAGNVAAVEAFRRPRVAILPTGSELRSAGKPSYKEGQIIESNGGMLCAMADECGGDGVIHRTASDTYDKLRAAIEGALEASDILVVNAASSAGTEDYTVSVLRELGEVVVHGVAMKPGRPAILAVVGGKPVVGAPGYPVAAAVAFRVFAAPIVRLLAGRPYETPVVNAVFEEYHRSPPGIREYLRVTLAFDDGFFRAHVLETSSSSTLSLVKADAFCVVPENRTNIVEGQTLPVELIRPIARR
jgi:putative molybdopterin biosynthesis protein